MDEDDWQELNELARSTIELSIYDALLFMMKVWTVTILYGLD